MTSRMAARVACISLIGGLVPAGLQAQAVLDPTPTQSKSVPPARRDVSTLTMTTSVATDDNGPASTSVLTDPQNRGVQFHSDLQAGVNYVSQPGRKLTWEVDASSAVRRQTQVNQFVLLGDSGGGSLMFSPGKRTQVSVTQSVGYIPSYTFAATPSAVQSDAGGLPASVLDYSLAKRPAYTFATNLMLTRQLGARSAVVFSSSLQGTEFVNHVDPSLKDWNGSARYTYQFSKYAGLRLGYGRRSGQYSQTAGTSKVQLDNLDLGIDYHRPLSFSRTTTVTFGSGSTGTLSGQQRHFDVTLTANLDQAIGRTGHLTLAYDRSAQLVQGFTQPVFADTVTASAGARIGARVNVSVLAAAGNGFVGAHVALNSYRTYTASTSVSLAVSSNTSVSGEYLFYEHALGNGVERIASVPNAQRRQTARVGLNWRLPLLREWIRGSGGR